MIYPSNFESKIGFDDIRQLLKQRCLSTLGKEAVDGVSFSGDSAQVNLWLRQVREFRLLTEKEDAMPLSFFFDMREAVSRLRLEGTHMEEQELFDLRRSLDTICGILTVFNRGEGNDEGGMTYDYPSLHDMAEGVMSFPNIVTRIDQIIDKFGKVKDTASPALADIRHNLAKTEGSISRTLYNILRAAQSEGLVDKDVAPTLRDGRLVIPVAPTLKRRIKGIVHDESATGKTVFVEPAEVVEANNRVRELEAEERREVIRILTELSAEIRPYVPQLLESYVFLGNVDLVRAKVELAKTIGGIEPKVESYPLIDWIRAVHPLLQMSLAKHDKKVVPLDITLTPEKRILLISGPNAGGKSVCLKTVSVVQYMTQCGLLPPVYSNSHIGIFKNIFVDIGDEQSIENDLSTYSSHLMNMKFFINNGGRDTLVLIDEFGGGTEPQIGGAIAQAMLARFNAKHMWGVITTHYQNLKHFADENDGIINGAMLYDRQHLQPLFQLSIGYPGSSFAVEIARKIGLPADVISEAEAIVGSDYVNMDKYLLDIARDRKYYENKRREIHSKEKHLQQLIDKYDSEVERLSGEQRDIIRAAKAEAKEILARSNASIERTIHEIKKAQAEKERTKEIRRQLDEFKERLEAQEEGVTVKRNPELKHKKRKPKEVEKPEEATAEIAVDDYVVIDGGNSRCLVLEVTGKQATVAIGEFKSKIDLKRLKKVGHRDESDRKVAFVSASTANNMRDRQLKFKQDIDVRGMRADEAIQTVTYFIDDALQFSAKTVRILHGTGNGILRQRIREYLNTVPGVKSYRDEHVQLGGAGITVIELG